MFYLIGLGISWKDISVKGLEILKKCDEIYVESYTSLSDFSVMELSKLVGKKVEMLYRNEVEGKRNFVERAKGKDIALLVYGDPLSATTHFEMIEEARKKKINFEVIHSSSIFTAVNETGLMLYKFGKTGSIPFWQENFKPESFFDILEGNCKIGAHTLFLLDLNPKEEKFMTSGEAVERLLEIAKKRKAKCFSGDSFCIACESLGMKKSKIHSGKAKSLLKMKFENPPFCLIVPGKLSDAEKEFIQN